MNISISWVPVGAKKTCCFIFPHLEPSKTSPARSVSTLIISMSTRSQGIVFSTFYRVILRFIFCWVKLSLFTWNSAPSMSRMNQFTVGWPIAARSVYRGTHCKRKSSEFNNCVCQSQVKMFSIPEALLTSHWAPSQSLPCSSCHEPKPIRYKYSGHVTCLY